VNLLDSEKWRKFGRDIQASFKNDPAGTTLDLVLSAVYFIVISMFLIPMIGTILLGFRNKDKKIELDGGESL